MSVLYDSYLRQHRDNVAKGYHWLRNNLPDLLTGSYDYEHQICYAHDLTKDSPEEYDAYDNYVYGNNRSYKVVQDFNYAWLNHIHFNSHHWQHWILIHDEPDEPETFMEIPYNYIIEMICDWWAFSWRKGNLMEVFDWYAEHKDNIKINPKSRKVVEQILSAIRKKLISD